MYFSEIHAFLFVQNQIMVYQLLDYYILFIFYLRLSVQWYALHALTH